MMTVMATLAGKRVLVTEDEYFIAKYLADDLHDAGADVLGPVATVSDALAVIANEPVDGAVVDLNLRGEMAYPVLDALLERGVPIVLATGYSARTLPTRYADVPRCDKPVDVDWLVKALFTD